MTLDAAVTGPALQSHLVTALAIPVIAADDIAVSRPAKDMCLLTRLAVVAVESEIGGRVCVDDSIFTGIVLTVGIADHSEGISRFAF